MTFRQCALVDGQYAGVGCGVAEDGLVGRCAAHESDTGVMAGGLAGVGLGVGVGVGVGVGGRHDVDIAASGNAHILVCHDLAGRHRAVAATGDDDRGAAVGGRLRGVERATAAVQADTAADIGRDAQHALALVVRGGEGVGGRRDRHAVVCIDGQQVLGHHVGAHDDHVLGLHGHLSRITPLRSIGHDPPEYPSKFVREASGESDERVPDNLKVNDKELSR